MTITEFKAYVKTGQALDTDEIHGFMHEMSEEARRVTFRLNTAYHTADEVRELLSELFGYQVPQSLRVFPPLYADFGKNISVGEGVFINAWRSDPWRWMPDWAQCGVRYAQPRTASGKKGCHPSCPYCVRQEGMGGLERHYPARGDDWRQCRCSRRSGRDQRRTGQYDCRWCPGTSHQAH